MPELLKWLEHDQIEVRYIASFAFEQLTGLDFVFPHFASRRVPAQGNWVRKRSSVRKQRGIRTKAPL